MREFADVKSELEMMAITLNMVAMALELQLAGSKNGVSKTLLDKHTELLKEYVDDRRNELVVRIEQLK